MPELLRYPSIRLVPLVLLAGLAACAPKPAAPPVVPAVFVSPVRNDSGTLQRVLFGQVRPRVEAEVAFRAGGKVAARLVEVGQAVRAGQALARIDPVDYQLAVRAAEEQQRAAEVDAVQAASDAARFRRLSADGSAGAADAERQQARADAAAARLVQAKQQAELARNRAGYTVLTAPFDGVVTALRFELGQVVGEGQPVLSLARPGDLEVVVDIPEPLVAGLKTWKARARWGDPAGAAAVQDTPLRLRELAPSASATTRTTRARFTPVTPTSASAWRMGMTAEVHLHKPERRSGAELPLGALLVTPAAAESAASSPMAALTSQPAVWLVNAGTGALTRQPVQLLLQTTDHVRVAGLDDGALVVTVGAQKLDAGMTVRPVERPLNVSPAAAAATTPR